jgi:hypothetical protein
MAKFNSVQGLEIFSQITIEKWQARNKYSRVSVLISIAKRKIPEGLI